MQRRITFWAIAGFGVAFSWMIFLAAAGPLPRNSPLWMLMDLTCPATIVGHSVPLMFYTALALNAATYALAGLIFELVRRSFSPQTSR